MKKLLFIGSLCVCLFFVNSSKGQVAFKPNVGLSFGTQGFGVEAGLPIAAEFLSLRVGGNYTPFEFQQARTFGNLPYNVDMQTDFVNAHAFLDLAPFSSNGGSFAKKFVVTAGAGYFFRRTGEAVASLSSSYFYGDIEVYNGDVGEVTAQAKWNKISPYAGIGLNGIKLDNKFNFNLGLGSYYLSSPSVKITGTKLLAGNETNEPQLKENLKDYKWLPVAQISLNYQF